MVFFVLSGFVIAYDLARGIAQQSYGFWDFCIDRISRIYSAYVPALIFIAVADTLLIGFRGANYSGNLRWRNFVGNFFMFQNYLGPFRGVPTYGSSGQL